MEVVANNMNTCNHSKTATPCQTLRSAVSNESNIINDRRQKCMSVKSSEGVMRMQQTREKYHEHMEHDQSETLIEELPVCERMKMHREEVAGRVLIPETWSQEQWLKDWMDCSSFDSLLAPKGVSSARQALVADVRRNSSTRSQRFRIQNSC